MSRSSSVREGDQSDLPRQSDGPWTVRQESIVEEEPFWGGPEFPFLFDTPFIEAYNSTVGIDPDKTPPVGSVEPIQDLGDLSCFALNTDAPALSSTDAATPSATSSSRGRAYNAPGETLSWVNGGQGGVHAGVSATNGHDIYHAHLLSNSPHNVIQPAIWESLNPYGGVGEMEALVGQHNGWPFPTSLVSTTRDNPQVPEAAWVATLVQDHQEPAAGQNEVLRPIDIQIPNFPSFTDLLELEVPQQGTMRYSVSAEDVVSSQTVGSSGMISDATPDLENNLVVNAEASFQSRDTTGNSKDETPNSTNGFAPILAPVASTAITKSVRRPKAPNADLTLADGMGKFATSRVRKAFSKDRRQEVAMTRQVGACFRCKVAKVTCRRPNHVDSVCERCLKGRLPATQICFKLDLSDCGFFRSGKRFQSFHSIQWKTSEHNTDHQDLESALHTEPFRNDFNWVTSATITLEVRMTPFQHSEPLRLACRHFRPKSNDLRVEFVRGSIPDEVVEVPTYAAVDTRALHIESKRLARQYGHNFLHELAGLGASEIVQRTLQQAFRHAGHKPQSLVNKALDLWAGSKLCQYKRTFDGAETLGLEPVADPESPIYEKIPIPPVLDHQCDAVIIQWMKDLGSQLVTLLWRKVCAKKREDWFEVFLTGFILINNIEYVYGLQKDYVQMYSKTTDDVSSRTQTNSERMMEQWKWSAQLLLYVCKTFFSNFKPLRDHSAESGADIGGLDPSQAAYLYYLIESKDAILAGRKSAAEVGDFNYEMVWAVELLEAM